MALLDGLSDVEWSRLHHAYGVAADVPDLLRALADPTNAALSLTGDAQRAGRTVRDHVEWTLWGNVFHQGTRRQVTAKVVPFLVEILRDAPKDEHLRRFLIRYLHHLAMGYPEDTFPERVDPEGAFRELDGMVAPDGEPDCENDVLPGIWARDSYLAVEHAIDIIAPFIHAEDESIAVEAIALVASFPRCKATTVPTLREVARARRDQRAAHAMISLSQLTGADALQDAELLVGAEQRAVAIGAACAAVLADPSRASAAAVALLTAPLGDAADVRSAHASSMTRLVGRCLSLVPEAYRDRAIDAIALQHQRANPLERLSLSASLLRLAFNGQRAPASSRDLTASQRRAVEAIRDYGAFRVHKSSFANYCGMVRHAGLPDSADALGKWLSGGDSPAGRQHHPGWKFWKR